MGGGGRGAAQWPEKGKGICWLLNKKLDSVSILNRSFSFLTLEWEGKNTRSYVLLEPKEPGLVLIDKSFLIITLFVSLRCSPFGISSSSRVIKSPVLFGWFFSLIFSLPTSPFLYFAVITKWAIDFLNVAFRGLAPY